MLTRPALGSSAADAAARDLRQILRFAAVGLMTTILDVGVFTLLTLASLHPAPANVMSYGLGIAVSYALNRRWTFGGEGSPLRALKFVAATVGGLAIGTVLLLILSDAMPTYLAKIATVPVVFFWNFALARLWVFREGA